jgi:hypothetical protein
VGFSAFLPPSGDGGYGSERRSKKNCHKELVMKSMIPVCFAMMATLCAPILSARAGDDTAPPGDRAELFEKFEQTLSGAKLVGQFTVLGKEAEELPKEEYVIKRVSKMPKGDYWLFQARIKYADKDVTLPLPLEVKWAGDTPMITLTDLAIPGLGTFSSRIVIDNNKYAGTWTHGKAGGHMFGVIEKLDERREDSDGVP